MRIFRPFLLGLLATLFVVNLCHAQQLMAAVWDTVNVPRRGPEAAAGLLVHFEDRFGAPIGKGIPPDFSIELAKEAKWDVLYLLRDPSVDTTSDDDRVLAFAAEQIDHAYRDEYKRIVVSGSGRGGWLALLASTLNNVDGAVAIAPATVNLSRERLEWQRDELARRLSRTKAKRIAIFFFRNDPLEGVDRAETTRRALRSNGATFMLIDRAPGNRESFTQKFKYCVLHLLRDNGLDPGEISCRSSDRAF